MSEANKRTNLFDRLVFFRPVDKIFIVRKREGESEERERVKRRKLGWRVDIFAARDSAT